MHWLAIFIPIAVIIILALVGIPLWQVFRRRQEPSRSTGRTRHERLSREAAAPDAAPQSRPVIKDPQE